MYMNEYFLQFHRHSLAPLKILEQEFDGKDLNEEEKEIFKQLEKEAKNNYANDFRIV